MVKTKIEDANASKVAFTPTLVNIIIIKLSNVVFNTSAYFSAKNI